MKIDERIEATVNRVAARVSCVWFLLMSISLCYRTLILKQHIRDCWDIYAIFLIGILYGFIAQARKGVLGDGFNRFWLTIFILVFIVNFTVFFLIGQIHSVVDVAEYLIGFLPGMALVIGIAYLLNRRWRRKQGIEEEK
ncbi:MAG: hypothetical protein JSU94_00980 [Phycisphaerales bacterium]|nr:MAG: hypothetical protein JSU94_00980 [Phycisphaerales bacterium]